MKPFLLLLALALLTPAALQAAPQKDGPRTPIAYYNRGIERLNDNQLDGAVADFSQAIKLNKKFVEAHRLLGKALRRKGDFKGALASFDKALELRPGDAETFVARAELKLTQEDLDGAVADCDKAIHTGAETARAFAVRASANVKKGSFDEALKDLDGALKDLDQHFAEKDAPGVKLAAHWGDPELLDYLETRATVKKHLKNFDGAIADYGKLLELNPRDAQALNARALLKGHQKRDFSGAIADLDKAIELDPAGAALFINRSSMRLQTKNWDGVIQDADAALEIDPSALEAYVNRAVAKEALKDIPGAVADYKKAVALDPDPENSWARHAQEALNRLKAP